MRREKDREKIDTERGMERDVFWEREALRLRKT